LQRITLAIGLTYLTIAVTGCYFSYLELAFENLNLREIQELEKIIQNIVAKHEGSKELQTMFHSLEEGIILVKDNKL